jgi:hypothetical protein
MKPIRRLAAFLFFVLTLLLAACSQQLVTKPIEPLVFSTPGTDFATDVTMYGSTLYVVGATEGTLDGTYLGFRDVIVRRYSFDGALMWGRQFGSSVSDQASFVAVDLLGSAYVLGHTNGSLTRQRNLGWSDIFLRKYDAFGTVLWTRQFGTIYSDIPFGIAVDNSYIYVASRSANIDNFSVRKYTLEGSFVSSFSNTDADRPDPSAFTKDTLGNFYVLAKINTGAVELFKYDPNGALLWSRVTPPPNETLAGGVVTDNTNAVYISWTSYQYTPDFEHFTAPVHIRKYNASGTVLFTTNILPGSTSDKVNLINRLSVDTGNAVYAAGFTQAAFKNFTNQGESDAFVLKYSPSGSRLWTRQFGTNSFDSAYGLVVSGRVFVVGYTAGNPNLLGGSSPGNGDGYVRSLDMNNGSVIWTDQ